jgi:hypothetical protein
MHSFGHSARGDDITKWTKRASSDPTRFIHFHISLAEIRQIADETADTVIFIAKMEFYLRRRMKNIPEGALPDIPPKPRKLTPFQPEATPRA